MIRNKFFFLFVLLLAIISACQNNSSEPEKLTSVGTLTATKNDTKSQAENDPATSPEGLDPSVSLSFKILATAEYDIQQRLKLVNSGPGSPAKHNLWVALINEISPYQEVLDRQISPDDYKLITDEYGNQIAEFDFSGMPSESEIEVQINYRLKINQLEYDLSPCQGELPEFFTEPELHIESQNPQILELSDQLSQGTQTACEQVRAFYDYIGDELVYSYNGGNWGAQAALGEMGADCTEYSSLMIALSRAAGIPARYIEGLSYTPEGNEALARQEHAWVEIYLPGIGWIPVDPTMGRSPFNRDSYFGKLSPDHIIVTRGRNPSALRGGSYWTYLYWPGNSTEIKIEEGEWAITPLEQ